jgi:type II secretory pathway pseudopilin PulG
MTGKDYGRYNGVRRGEDAATTRTPGAVQGTAFQRRQGRRTRLRAAAAGFSLVEVLIVLVVILLGLFSIMRIFPLGLGTLQTTSNRTLSGQLANQLAQQIQEDANSLPQGVVIASINGSTVTLDGNQDPDDLRSYPAGSAVNPYFSDVNTFRYILGEAVKIPPATAVSLPNGSATPPTVNGAPYLLKFGPMYIDPTDGDPGSAVASGYIHVYGAPLQGISAPYIPNAQGGDNSGDLAGYLQGDQTYLIDYGNNGATAHIMFPADLAGKAFLISFSYINSAGTLVQVNQQLLTVPGTPGSANGPVWQPVPDTTNAVVAVPGMVAGSDQVHREFTRMAVSGGTVAWTNDPYEYAVVQPNYATTGNGSTLTNANIGQLVFSPYGANYGERTATGQQDFTAYVDYMVYDWHIIHDDRSVPLGAVGTRAVSGGGTVQDAIVHTTLPNLKQQGDVNPDNTLYGGMFGSSSNDLIVIDTQTGRILNAGDWSNPNPATDDYWVDSDQTSGTYKTGTIYVNTATVPQGTDLRIFYMADGDWAVALQKAYSSYQLVAGDSNGYPPTTTTNGNTPSVTVDPRQITAKTFTDSSGAQHALLYFAASETGKSFVARFQYTRLANIVGGVTVTPDGVVQTDAVQVTVGDKSTWVSEIVGGVTVNVAVADVTASMPGIDLTQPWSLVGNAANGVSVKARVIYRDANSAAASINPSSPAAGWQIQDVDSYLTRNTNQP